MKAQHLFFGSVFAAILSAGAFAAAPDLVPAMAALDRAYIPALGLSGQAEQQAKAKVAFGTFENAWNDFKTSYAKPAGFDAEWSDDLAKVERAVGKAKTELLSNANGPAAHEALEAVRMTLLESRTRLGVPYFVDYLTLFHNSMEDLLNEKPAGKLSAWSASEKLGVEADLDMAIARWKKVKAEEALLSGASLSAKAEAVYEAQWKAIDSVMAGAKAALTAGDEKAFSEKLGQLKPNFIKTFFLFGDFPK